MLEAALQNRAALQAFVKDHSELQYLKFDKERWKRLKQIRDLLKPFEQHTLYVSREEPTIHRVPNLYLKLDQLLQSIIRKQGDYASYDHSLIKAAKKGLEIFNKYYLAMKSNDMYWIASILDPRIKTNWLKKNHPNAQDIIARIKKFIKEAYPTKQQLPERPASDSQ
jgi:pantothenate kinase